MSVFVFFLNKYFQITSHISCVGPEGTSNGKNYDKHILLFSLVLKFEIVLFTIMHGVPLSSQPINVYFPCSIILMQPIANLHIIVFIIYKALPL